MQKQMLREAEWQKKFSFVAPSSEALWVPMLSKCTDMVKVVTRVDLSAHNCSLDGATKLKCALFCCP